MPGATQVAPLCFTSKVEKAGESSKILLLLVIKNSPANPRPEEQIVCYTNTIVRARCLQVRIAEDSCSELSYFCTFLRLF